MRSERRLVFTAACLGMLTFGIVITVLGAILPALITRFGVGKAEAGSLFLVLSLGNLAGSAIFGPVVDRYGYKGLLIACALFILAGLEGIAFAPTFGLLLAAVFVIGVGGGGMNGGTNALVSDISADGRSAGLSLLGVFFGLGAFVIPFVLGFLLVRFGYTVLVAGIGALVLVPLGFFVALGFPTSKQPHGFPLGHVAALLRDPVLLLMGAMLFLQSGIEITMGGWTTTYAIEHLGMASGAAAWLLSLFWLGLTIARLVLGKVLRRRSPARVLQVSLGGALVGAVLLVAATGPVLAGAGLFFAGAGLSAGFPVIFGIAGDRYPHLTGTAFGLLLAMALVGGSLLPYLAGFLAEGVGLRSAFIGVPLSLAFILALFSAVVRRRAAEAVRG